MKFIIYTLFLVNMLFLSGCDPVYGGIENAENYPMKIGILWSDSNETYYYDISADQKFLSRDPDAYVVGIYITDKYGNIKEYNKYYLERIAYNSGSKMELARWLVKSDNVYLDTK